MKFTRLLVLLLALWGGAAYGTSSVRQEQQQSLNTGAPVLTQTSTALSAAALSGSTIAVWVTNDTSAFTAAPTSVIDSCSQNYTLRSQINDVAHTQQFLLYTFSNSTCISAFTVTATWAVTTGGTGVWVAEITGVSPSAYQGVSGQLQTSPGTGTNVITSTTVTPSSQPCLMYAMSFMPSSPITAALTVGTGFTAGPPGFAGSGATKALSESQHLTSTSAIAGTFTDATNGGGKDYITIAAVFTDAVASTGQNGSMMLRGVGN